MREIPARREYGLVLLAGAAGAALILIAVRERWAKAVFTPPKPLSAQVVGVSGADLIPLATKVLLSGENASSVTGRAFTSSTCVSYPTCAACRSSITHWSKTLR